MLAELRDREPAVERELSRLLEHDEAGSSFLEHPMKLGELVGAAARSSDASPLGDLSEFHVVPEWIGEYRVLGLIGAGGMGVVYRARQQQPARDVAIKVLKPGGASAAALRRFELEADVLGRLRHPGIAQVFEAGVADLVFANGATAQRPFLVMELVPGASLTHHLQQRQLPLRARLELFAAICDAVQHAHQNGVIHRDLKPGNILVGNDTSLPKVIDFGIARVADLGVATLTIHTTAAQLLGTLPYMSPEQLAGGSERLDTRADIYSLGAILYEMLSGRLPYEVRDRSAAELIRLREHVEPAPLRHAAPQIDDELATIVHKALERSPQRRYSSSAELADDVRRWLGGFPILAQPPSAWYQIRKLVARHRALFIGASTAWLAIAAGAGAALYEASIANREARLASAARDDAQHETARAEQHAADARGARAEAEQSRDEAESVVGFLVEMLTSADPDQLGREVLVRDVLDEMSPQIDSRWSDHGRVEARLHDAIGRTYATLGQLQQARDHLQRAYDLHDDRLGAMHDTTIDTARHLATVLDSLSDSGRAEALLRDAHTASVALHGEIHETSLAILSDIGAAEFHQLKLRDAEATFRRVIAQAEPLLAASAPLLIDTRNRLADLLSRVGATEEASRLYRQSLDAMCELGSVADARRLCAKRGLAAALLQSGRPDEALPVQQEVLASLRSRLGTQHPDTIGAMHDLARVLVALGRAAEAEPLVVQVVESATVKLGPTHPNTVRARVMLAQTQAAQGRRDDACELLARTISTQCDDVDESIELGEARQFLAAYLAQDQRYSDALPYYRASLRIFETRLSSDHWQTAAIRVQLGMCLVNTGMLEEGERELLEAHQVLSGSGDAGRSRALLAAQALAECYQRMGRIEEAAKWRGGGASSATLQP